MRICITAQYTSPVLFGLDWDLFGLHVVFRQPLRNFSLLQVRRDHTGPFVFSLSYRCVLRDAFIYRIKKSAKSPPVLLGALPLGLPLFRIEHIKETPYDTLR